MRKLLSSCLLGMVLAFAFPPGLQAEDAVEKAGVVIGRTVGNAIFIPVKLVTVLWGVAAGAIAYPLSAGNTELTKQIWRDTAEGPYVITPELARMAIGERPELEEARPEYR